MLGDGAGAAAVVDPHDRFAGLRVHVDAHDRQPPFDRREHRGVPLGQREHDHAVDSAPPHGRSAPAPTGGTGNSVRPTSASSATDEMPRRNSTAPGSAKA